MDGIWLCAVLHCARLSRSRAQQMGNRVATLVLVGSRSSGPWSDLAGEHKHLHAGLAKVFKNSEYQPSGVRGTFECATPCCACCIIFVHCDPRTTDCSANDACSCCCTVRLSPVHDAAGSSPIPSSQAHMLTCLSACRVCARAGKLLRLCMQGRAHVLTHHLGRTTLASFR